VARVAVPLIDNGHQACLTFQYTFVYDLGCTEHVRFNTQKIPSRTEFTPSIISTLASASRPHPPLGGRQQRQHPPHSSWHPALHTLVSEQAPALTTNLPTDATGRPLPTTLGATGARWRQRRGQRRGQRHSRTTNVGSYPSAAGRSVQASNIRTLIPSIGNWQAPPQGRCRSLYHRVPFDFNAPPQYQLPAPPLFHPCNQRHR